MTVHHCNCTHTIHAKTDSGLPNLGLPDEITRLVEANTGILTQIFQVSKEDLLLKFSYTTNMDELAAMLKATVNSGVLVIPKNDGNLSRFYENVGKAWDYGITREGNPNYITQLIRDSVTQNTEKYVTKLDTDIKSKLSGMINQSIEHNRTVAPNQRIYPEQLARNMAAELDKNVPRARAISRTETMRAANLGSWAQAKAEGKTHFIVDNRAESCKRCFEIVHGKVFLIDEKEYVPPYHPNCNCIVHYFSDEELAQESADEIATDNLKRRKYLEDKGYTLPKDGTGPLAPGVTPSKYAKNKKRFNEAIKGDVGEPIVKKTSKTRQRGENKEYIPSKKETEALHTYNVQDDPDVNYYLRKNKLPKNTIISKSELKATIKNDISTLDKLISKNKTTKNNILYRGVSDKYYKNISIGDHVSDKSFISTSKSFSKAAEFTDHTIFEIKLPSGSNAVQVDTLLSQEMRAGRFKPFTTPHLSEEEFLLPRNSEFKCVGTKKMKDEWAGTMNVIQLEPM